jgi:hypothetical protein
VVHESLVATKGSEVIRLPSSRKFLTHRRFRVDKKCCKPSVAFKSDMSIVSRPFHKKQTNTKLRNNTMKKIVAILALVGFVTAATAGDSCCPASKGKTDKKETGKTCPAGGEKKADKPA